MSMTKDELIALRRERGKQELNIGDKVKVYDQDGTALYDGKVFEITGKGKCDNKFVYRLDGLMNPFHAEDLELVKSTLAEEIEAARQESLHLMKQAAQAQAGFNETQYWQHYRAELVKELAVKMADNNSITIPKICDYITDFAARIVENLKKQEV